MESLGASGIIVGKFHGLVGVNVNERIHAQGILPRGLVIAHLGIVFLQQRQYVHLNVGQTGALRYGQGTLEFSGGTREIFGIFQTTGHTLQGRDDVALLAVFLEALKGLPVANHRFAVFLLHFVFRAFKIMRQRDFWQEIFRHGGIGIRCHFLENATRPGIVFAFLFHITTGIKIAIVSIQCAYLRPLFLRQATLQELLGQKIALFITRQFTITAAGHRLADDVRLAFCLTALQHGVAPNFQKGFEGLSVFLGFFERKSLMHLVHHCALAEVLRR